MGLTEYKKKRSFEKTPEPTGGKSTDNKLTFVIQKHAASRLHYDFRLELQGVLKSWAVPKGPSLNPADKRLAMLVEDHPYDYRTFEGIIPAGNYGAGTVIVWDEGTYEPIEPATSKAEQEKKLLQDFQKGSMKIRMDGAKLKGEFALVKLKGRDENAWLLIKHRDQFATDEDITEQDRSVVSGKTIEELAHDTGARQWKSNRDAKPTKVKTPVTKAVVKTVSPKKAVKRKAVTPVTKSRGKKKDDTKLKELLSGIGKKRKILQEVKPMLATLVDKPFHEEGWLYEVKWDGFRAISYLQGEEVEIRSRNNKDFNKKFYPIYQALKDWSVQAVVDGEIIVINERGMPDFNALQEWRSEADGQLVYYLFDILWLDGYDLTHVPLQDRKNILQQIIPADSIIRMSENFDINGQEFFTMANKMGLEGILAKKSDSKYLQDIRSKDWLKIKTEKHQEAVIAGYTRNENTSKQFSALLMGVYENGKLVFIGPVGTGFNTALQKELREKMKPLETSVCPFSEIPDYNKPSRFRPNPPKAEVTWLKPKLVAEVTYRAIGGDGGMRHPSFRGLREDKDAKQVTRESPLPVAEVFDRTSEENTASPLEKKIATKVKTGERKTLLNPQDETQVRKIDGHDLKFTNLSKVFWPEQQVTKRDMLNYYYQVVPYMLPYMQDRPQTLNRFPNGIYGKSFYQKDVTGKVPDWIKTHRYYSDADQREKNFLVCTDEASLLYIASMGCIEINPWSSRTQFPDNPDWCIIDLDPDKNSFDQVIVTAQVTKQVLDDMGIPSFCKTSGSTGLHIYIPLGAQYTYEDSKEFGRAIVKRVHAEIPDFTSIERLTANRKGKIYLDFLQNRPQATVAGPYSLRPKPGAPVSMPLHWEEVKKRVENPGF